MKHTVIALIAGILLSHSGMAADTVRVMTYNVLKFSQDNVDGRIPNFARIIDSIRPDVMVCQEVDDASMGPLFVTDVFTWAPFAGTPFIDGPDTDCQLFYDQTKFDFLSQRRISTELRDIAEFTLVTRPTNALPPDTVVFYGCHLKASDGSSEAQQRAREVAAMMAQMTTRRFAFVAGDLNVYSPQEQAYRNITGSTAVRTFIDPLGPVWMRNTPSFAGWYTQCTRATQVSSCGGGVDGGLDDRFDFIFVSQQLEPRVVKNSYTHFGNDGLPRLNASINNPTNTLVSQAMADALLCASDHLPIYVDVILGDVQASVGDEGAPVPTIRFTGSEAIITHCTIGSPITITDLNGRVVYRINATSEVMNITVSHLPHGIYFFHHSTHTSTLAH
ncbi:MAG: hypothetical protein EHM43_06910 [Ignavibacteriae bacterium]|nr:MAG: hypothetical protein EHM43_06910 [Ignavibacteriota bacterium]